ncbi:MAG: SH3 domain-containing protein [Chloroflexi bacterium]|jgi:hypothetical protein|nr:SH3 domain-containing protein [Chloroflexota bacterium]
MKEDASERGDREPVPWKWLGMGLVLAVLGCIAVLFLLRAFLALPSEQTAGPRPATIVVLTAPPSPTTDPTGSALPPTSIPTFTPIPTPDAAIAPPQVTIGFYAAVANTDGLGVTVRGGPSTRNVALLVAEEGALVMVLGGPEAGDGFEWWQIQLADGTEGWAAANFLEPAAAP